MLACSLLKGAFQTVFDVVRIVCHWKSLATPLGTAKTR
jgi:hypothetical protein